MTDVFISHHTDSAGELATKIHDALEKEGISCFLAQRDTGSGVYSEKIAEALETCKIFLLLLNDEAQNSTYVLNEVSIAVDRHSHEKNIEILPVKIGDFPLSGQIKLYINAFQIQNGNKLPKADALKELTGKIKELLTISQQNQKQAAQEKLKEYAFLEAQKAMAEEYKQRHYNRLRLILLLCVILILIFTFSGDLRKFTNILMEKSESNQDISPTPTVQPTDTPTPTPTSTPTPTPVPDTPTPYPTVFILAPNKAPTFRFIIRPTVQATDTPIPTPTVQPTDTPTPTVQPTNKPTSAPYRIYGKFSTHTPTLSPADKRLLMEEIMKDIHKNMDAIPSVTPTPTLSVENVNLS